MKRNTLVFKLFASTLWEYWHVLKTYTRGVCIGPRLLHFGDCSDLQNSLICQKIPFTRPVRQLELPRKASVIGIRNSHIVKNREQNMLVSGAMCGPPAATFLFLFCRPCFFLFFLFRCSHMQQNAKEIAVSQIHFVELYLSNI